LGEMMDGAEKRRGRNFGREYAAKSEFLD
jgi:hypothetical protein